MPAADEPRRALPDHPSEEHLRKQAKRLARETGVRLSQAQRRLARDYGFADWAALMRQVKAPPAAGPEGVRSPLSEAAAAGDVAEVSRLLADGHSVDGVAKEAATPLWWACASAPEPTRTGAAERLLDAGASVTRRHFGATPLHVAAREGPQSLVELLIRHGAVDWYPDGEGRPPLAWAQEGSGPDKATIVALLDRTLIRDPNFRAAVDAVRSGDVAALDRLLAEHPYLLRERILGPEAYRAATRTDYFRDPKLFWFIAFNPRPEGTMPSNMADVARTMIGRGVEADDLDYALELVMTSAAARETGQQIPLIEVLVVAGATPLPKAVLMTAGHRELGALEALLRQGVAMTPVIAAALGRADALAGLLPACDREELQAALAAAVINDQVEAAQLALGAGAAPDQFMPVHTHSLPLHQAALNDNVPMLTTLISRGARHDVPDQLWHGTPLDWARHEGRPGAQAYLQSVAERLADQVTVRLDRAARARRENRYDQARAELAQARGISEESGDRQARARVLKALGQLERDEGLSDTALDLYQQAAVIQRESGDPFALAHTIRHLGEIHHENGRREQAGECFREALALYRSQQGAPPLDLANALRPLAILLEETGETAEAAQLWREARDLYAAAGVPEGATASAERLGRLRPS